MPYNEKLAERIRTITKSKHNITERKMFGGLCFMLSGNMCCGVQQESLMVRVGPEQYQQCLAEPHAREMDFTGRPLKGMLYITAEGIRDDQALLDWLGLSVQYVASLPPK